MNSALTRCDGCFVCDNRSGSGGAGNTTRSLTARPQLTASGGARAVKSIPHDLAQVLANRILNRADITETCWLATSASVVSGYASIATMVAGRREYFYAHRVVYIALRSPIPDGMTIDHLCRVRNCVNPDHLEVVTMRENVLRSDNPLALNARRIQCPKGHPYAILGQRRTCTECRRAAARQRYASGKPFLPIDDPRHGTLNGYTNRRCRCDACSAASKAAYRARRAASAQ